MMRRIILLLVLFMSLFPVTIYAKENCKVVSGNGKDLGSEIACDTEHFYILESNDEEIKALAKYNLYTGVKINSYT